MGIINLNDIGRVREVSLLRDELLARAHAMLFKLLMRLIFTQVAAVQAIGEVNGRHTCTVNINVLRVLRSKFEVT